MTVTAYEATRWRVAVPRRVEEAAWLARANAMLKRAGWRLMVLSDSYPWGPFYLTLMRRVWSER